MLPTMWKSMSNDLWTLHRDIDDLFNRFFAPMERSFSQLFSTPTSQQAAWYPAVESYTTEGELHVDVHLPGVNLKGVQINAFGKELTISGERPWEEQWEKSRQYYFREIPYGRFERKILLPIEVDADKVHAKFQDGVLHITLPVPSTIAPKKIEIETGEVVLK
jgi:HSP20 family protein